MAQISYSVQLFFSKLSILLDYAYAKPNAIQKHGDNNGIGVVLPLRNKA